MQHSFLENVGGYFFYSGKTLNWVVLGGFHGDLNFFDLHEKPLHSLVTVRQALDTHIEKPRHFKTAIAAELKVVLTIRKHIWNCRFKFYILSFVHIVTKIFSSELLAYNESVALHAKGSL